MAREVDDIQEEEDEQVVVDIESKLEATLKEIEELRKTSKKHIK